MAPTARCADRRASFLGPSSSSASLGLALTGTAPWGSWGERLPSRCSGTTEASKAREGSPGKAPGRTPQPQVAQPECWALGLGRCVFPRAWRWLLGEFLDLYHSRGVLGLGLGPGPLKHGWPED